jgi:hypothetical protein
VVAWELLDATAMGRMWITDDVLVSGKCRRDQRRAPRLDLIEEAWVVAVHLRLGGHAAPVAVAGNDVPFSMGRRCPASPGMAGVVGTPSCWTRTWPLENSGGNRESISQRALSAQIAGCAPSSSRSRQLSWVRVRTSR